MVKKGDILIGADNYYRFIYGNIIRGKIHELVAVESSFGWLVTAYFENLSANTFVNLNSTHVLRITTHVISQNVISKKNVISKDQKVSFLSWKTLLIKKRIVTKTMLQMSFT